VWKTLAGVAVGYALAQWVVPALLKKPSPTDTAAEQASGELGIYRITGDMINAFDQIKPFLWQLHQDSADGDLSVADYMRAARQLQRSGVI